MLYTIQNGHLLVTVNDKGAELWSIQHDGHEYLWNGDPAFWGDRAPTLFPYIARLKNGTYTLHGRSYRMDIHGFAKDAVFAVEATADALVLTLCANTETKKQYPHDFVFRVRYTLAGTALDITYEVENRGNETMYFALGGHPGFRMPLEDGLAFDDYTLTFARPCNPTQILFSKDDVLVTGSRPYPLADGRSIALTHALFNDDAIILGDTCDSVRLTSAKGNRAITVRYPDFRYIGFWHVAPSEAPYVCIEPWSSLPSRQDRVEELSAQPDLLSLPANDSRQFVWSISID